MSRRSNYPILPQILNRHSPRSMNGEEISEEELMTIFEAGRWAPSSYNGQPWRFIYSRRGDEAWENFLSLLIEFNQSWAKEAGSLVCVISRKTFTHNDKPSKTHSFDTGAAWENAAIQGTSMGLVVHGMQGFNYKKAAEILKIPDDHQVEIMFAVGRPGSQQTLPEEIQKIEKLSDRNPLESLVMKGYFKE